MLRSPRRTGGRSEQLVTVRLSEIPMELRQAVSDKLRDKLGARTPEEALLEWGLATTAVRQDPTLTVPEWKARLVLRDHKLPDGPIPKYLLV